jgi:flagellar protein FliO/FliZ
MIKLTLLPRAVAQVTAVLGACLLGFACPASAFTSASKESGGENTPLNLSPSTPAAHSTSSGGASIVRTIVGLAIVIAVIWGLSWILRQVKSSRDPHQTSSTGLASVAALTLGSGRTLHLVRAGNDYVLLGGGEHGLVPIYRYTEEQAREAGLPTIEEPPERTRRFARAGAEPASNDRFIAVNENHSVVAAGTPRPNPMRMPSSSSGLLERVRELTVRR